MPFPSRSELNTLKQETTKTLDEVLSLATAASVRAEQAVQQSTDNRLDRLLQQRVDLQARSAAAPNDVILKQSLARTDIDIARLLGQTTASSTTAVK
jgi:rRNA-processing protein FCF1